MHQHNRFASVCGKDKTSARRNPLLLRWAAQEALKNDYHSHCWTPAGPIVLAGLIKLSRCAQDLCNRIIAGFIHGCYRQQRSGNISVMQSVASSNAGDRISPPIPAADRSQEWGTDSNSWAIFSFAVSNLFDHRQPAAARKAPAHHPHQLINSIHRAPTKPIIKVLATVTSSPTRYTSFTSR